MQEDRKFEVKWRLVNSSTFMYGTKLRFNQDNIYFENPLMPSGTIIHSWYMLTDFAEDRVSPKLPIFEPKGAAYFKMKFYRKNKEILSHQILKNKKENIVYPREAYSYDLELINAGINHLSFRNIIVQELREDSNQAYETTKYIDPEKKLKVINQIITNIRTHHLDTSNYHRSDMNG
ncbi:MAG: accessory Sec system protein Asp3 [Staphylococcus epidermidis]|nr:accessory Sec system protein Asp3 [Staphylococcus epidermidis]